MKHLVVKSKAAVMAAAVAGIVAMENLASAQESTPLIVIDWNAVIEDLGDSLQSPVAAAIGIGTAIFGVMLVWRLIKRFARG